MLVEFMTPNAETHKVNCAQMQRGPLWHPRQRLFVVSLEVALEVAPGADFMLLGGTSCWSEAWRANKESPRLQYLVGLRHHFFPKQVYLWGSILEKK